MKIRTLDDILAHPKRKKRKLKEFIKKIIKKLYGKKKSKG
jgi:hypothetical protein